jgi:hypothetical protein
MIGIFGTSFDFLGTNNKLKITHNKIKINMQNKNMHDDEM